jgi:leucyl-tRNA synthetase
VKKEMEDKYHPKLIESKWQKKWESEEIFKAGREPSKPKFYVLEMFPYPSGNLHMGHVRVYVIGDVLARYYRMKGCDVLHPMGWDSFGLPAENAAMRDGIHPKTRTYQNIDSVRRQMNMLGLSFDWERELATSDPEYYRWNQWFFLKMYERGLVYRRESLANWCTGCMTVLANEQVVDGQCERCKKPVVQRQIPDWAFRITDYAEELLNDLNRLEFWPDRVVAMQRNWIGRSEGCNLQFPVKGDVVEPLDIFTTRSDTVYGATYMVLAPEHPAVSKLTSDGQRIEVEKFIQKMSVVDKAVRTDVNTEKEGVWTGSFAINPFTKEEIPIWIANFVLAGYGTGAVMSVPAHDQRDFEFAKKYELGVRVVIQPDQKDLPQLNAEEMSEAFVDDGRLVDSGVHSGKSSAQAREDIASQARQEGKGGATVGYHLRDWGISRQRYWGTPIPIVYCEKCGMVAVDEKSLPVELPADAPITGTGEAPLAKVEEFVNTSCPKCGGPAKRETDTMDTFVDSAWYFARYLDPKNDKAPFSKELADHWLPLDIYVGGPEHAVMHLLYFRFWTKVMRDLGLTSIDEPASRLLTQGMVVRESYYCEEHGYRAIEEIDEQNTKQPKCVECGRQLEVRVEKMSKTKLNGVAPEEMCNEYGADTARLFGLFAAPPEKDIEWSDSGVAGCYNFLRRVWTLYHRFQSCFEVIRELDGPVDESLLSSDLIAFHRLVHRTIARVTNDIEKELQFNTAIAALMEMLNAAKVFDSLPMTGSRPTDSKDLEGFRLLGFGLRTMALLLCPLAPHFVEEIWESLGMQGRASLQPWPEFDPNATVDDKIKIAVQVNGKVRSTIEVDKDASKETLEAEAKADQKVSKWIEGKEIRRVIVVPARLVNIVVS